MGILFRYLKRGEHEVLIGFVLVGIWISGRRHGRRRAVGTWVRMNPDGGAQEGLGGFWVDERERVGSISVRERNRSGVNERKKRNFGSYMGAVRRRSV